MAVLFDDDDVLDVCGRLLMNEIIIRIDSGLPDLVKFVFVIAFADDDIERLLLRRETQGLVKSPVHLSGLCGRFPFAINAAEAARPGHRSRVGIYDCKGVFAAKRRVDRPMHIAGPAEGLQDDLIEAEYFKVSISGVIEIDAHRLRLPGKGQRRD